MINLMYVVLMAMLALNVSTEVLEGFSLVEESLNRTTDNSSKQNAAIYGDFEAQMKKNPGKVKQWFEKATQVKQMSDSLYNFAQLLKEEIVREADGSDGNLKDIRNKEDLEAASHVMLAPGTGKGKRLYDAINQFRERILSLVTDEHQKEIIRGNLTTELPKNAHAMGKNWQEYMFEGMPVAAAVTLLSKIQSDVRYAEGEVLHNLVSNIDLKDIRVNKLDAFVIPEKTTLYPGEQFTANIVMAAVDTTQTPEIYVNGVRINSTGKYSFTAGGVGEHSFQGYLLTRNAAGEDIRRNFLQKYTVIPAPSGATVAADLMNVLYAGYSNPLSISVPGVPVTKIQASMSGGTLQPVGPGKYIARPSTPGQNVTITVTSTNTGRPQQMGTYTFRVRRLPDPTPYIVVSADGGADRFKGGGLSKGQLTAADGIGAAIDDGILDVPFHVQSFETVFFDNMGNAVPMVSDGSRFSARQKETFRKLQRNRRFYISRVTATGPDGTARKLNASMEVIVK